MSNGIEKKKKLSNVVLMKWNAWIGIIFESKAPFKAVVLLLINSQELLVVREIILLYARTLPTYWRNNGVVL